MSWSQHHKRSELHASEAELCRRQGNEDKARELYALAADAGEKALAEVGADKSKTYGISAVNAAALRYKAGEYDSAEKIISESLELSWLPHFAQCQLSNIRKFVRSRRR